MKKVWECTWEIAPGDGVHTQRYPTRAAAVEAMRRIICQCTIVLEDLQTQSPEISEFMNKYLSDPHFPYSDHEVPDIWEELDDLEDGERILNSAYIKLHYLCNTVPYLATNMVIPSDDDDGYHFDLWYENPEKLSDGGVGGIHIRIQERLDYGTSAYPIMVLGCLTEEPKTQKQIIDEIEQRFRCTLERKAVGRHIEMLKALKYDIQQCKTGYYIPQPPKRLTPAEWCSVMDCVRAYPDMSNDFREVLLSKLKSLADG